MSLNLNKLSTFFGVSIGCTLLYWDIDDLQIIIFLHTGVLVEKFFNKTENDYLLCTFLTNYCF